MASRLGFDILAAVILGVTAALGAYMPLFLASRDRLAGGNGRSVTLILGNMFSAGVMVSAGFCHLLGEAVRQMPDMEFSLATFLCGLGYMLTLCADKAATTLSGIDPTDEAVEVAVGVDLLERRGSGVLVPGRGSDEEGTLLLSRAEAGSAGVRNKDSGGVAGGAGNGNGIHTSTPAAAGNGSSEEEYEGWGYAEAADVAHQASFEVETAPVGAAGTAAGPQRLLRSGSAPRPQQQQRHHHGHNHSIPASVSFATAVLMGVALCFHSLLEGAAMGAQPTLANSLHIFIAIVSHKGLAAYALGSSIAESTLSKRRFWSVILPFTLASPAGIFLGYIISDLAQGLGAASISALASGTFLYVAFMEVIPRELHDPSHSAAKLFCLLLGFALMSLLAIWA